MTERRPATRVLRRARRRARQGGAVAILAALLLTFVLFGFVAFAIDGGHLFEVRNELQNAADSASLAGVMQLNGTLANILLAPAAAQNYAQKNNANGTPVNVPLADIQTGSWNFTTRVFTPLPLSALPADVDAVRVTTRRSAATGNAVQTWFARVFGVTQTDVTSSAVAVGGGPANACGFPLALAECDLFDDAGNLKCGQTLVFNSNLNNTAFTLLTLANPDTPTIECAMATAVAYPTCPNKCTCSPSCLATHSGDTIRISNGNNLSQNDITYINWAVMNSPTPGHLYVTVPVISTGGVCPGPGSGALTGDVPVEGYAKLDITGATGPSPKIITTTIDCSHTAGGPPGGAYYGYTTPTVSLVK